MYAIKFDQVAHAGPRDLMAEASDIGLRPGEWPDFIAVLNDQNEGLLFQKLQVNPECGIYCTKSGAVQLEIIND